MNPFKHRGSQSDITELGSPVTARWTAAMVGILAGLVVSTTVSSCILVRGRTGDRIRFPLEPHLHVIDDCATCHEGVAGHDVGSDTRRALEAACLACHGERKDDCSYCHSDVESAGSFPEKERNLTFSHETHLVRTKGDCAKCHPRAHSLEAMAGDVVHPTALPAHRECFSCHEMQQFYDELRCANCHENLSAYGLAPYEKFTHTTDFMRKEHGEFVRAAQSARTCAQCHETRFCSQCHAEVPLMHPEESVPEKLSFLRIHPGDYTYRHMWDVRADSASCLRCHGQRFCNDCHETRGITQTTAMKHKGGFTFHGPGVLAPGSPDFHGSAARRDIVSCAACHRDGERGDCLECHSLRSPSFIPVSPHPPGFKSRLSRTGAPVCRLCHVR